MLDWGDFSISAALLPDKGARMHEAGVFWSLQMKL
jgi:hypothetical protein